MNNFRVEMVKHVECNLSASQWELYTNSFPREEIEAVADKINKDVKFYFNECRLGRQQFVAAMEKVLMQYKEFGAADTEPRRVLWTLAEEAYNG